MALFEQAQVPHALGARGRDEQAPGAVSQHDAQLRGCEQLRQQGDEASRIRRLTEVGGANVGQLNERRAEPALAIDHGTPALPRFAFQHSYRHTTIINVPHPESTLADIAALWRRVESERQRAARAAGLAARYQAQRGPEQLQEFRARMASLYQCIEARHLAAAKMHQLHAIRMERWLRNPGTLRPVFMTAVAATLGLRSATATLCGRRQAAAAVAASDETARAAHDLEIVLGEGPAAAAMTEGALVQATGATLCERWPTYGPAVAELGVRAVVAAPLLIRTRCFGVLCAYGPGPAMGGDIAAVTERIADALIHTILDADADGALDMLDEDFLATVNQAIGKVAAYHECAVEDAEALLRARAFADNRPVRDVALDVVEGRTRLS